MEIILRNNFYNSMYDIYFISNLKKIKVTCIKMRMCVYMHTYTHIYIVR